MGGHPGPATSARGCVRCKRQQHPPCPAHPVYSHRECLVPCRMVAMPATPGKEPPGVATRMPLAQKDNRRAALYSLPVLREGLCPRRRHRKQRAQLPPHPERRLGEWGRGCHFAQKNNSMLAVGCHPSPGQTAVKVKGSQSTPETGQDKIRTRMQTAHTRPDFTLSCLIPKAFKKTIRSC